MKPALQPLLPFAAFLMILPFPGTVALRLLLLALCAGIAFWQWRRVPGAGAVIPCQAALLAWVLVAVASLANGFNVAYSLGELKNEIGYSMLAFLAFFIVARDRRQALFLLRALGIGLLLIGGWGTVAWAAQGFEWPEGGLSGGIGVFATYLVTIAPALLWLALAERSATARRAAAGLVGFALFLLIITAQRAVWPVLALQAIVALFMATRAGATRFSLRRLAAASALLLALALAGMLYSQQARYAGVSDRNVQLTTDARLGFWPKVAARIGEHPLAGAGFGRSIMLQAYPELIPPQTPALWHAHNLLLNYGLQMGLPGMLALLLLFGAFIRHFWQAAAQGSGPGPGPGLGVGIAGLAIVLGVLLRNQFNDFFVRDMSLLFWSLTGIFARLAVAARQGNSSDQQTPA